jgi:hypothetical protein
MFYGIPDILGVDRSRYANKTVLVAGSGASAFNALLDLVQLHAQAPQTKVIWVLRRELGGELFGGGEQDQLPARGALGQRVRALVDQGRLEIAASFKVTELRSVGSRIEVCSDNRVLQPVDEIIVTTGFRPDLAMLSEVRLSLDPGVESPTILAPMIDPNFHSCGTVRPHGVEELKHPEQNFYIIGSKSYGRAPTFLLLTGYEQARSVVAAIAGDWESARQVQLVLPETGVCSRPVSAEFGGACCGVEADESQPAYATVTLLAANEEVTNACCGSTPVEVVTLYDARPEENIAKTSQRNCCG